MEKPVDNKPRKRIVIKETDSDEEEEKEGQFNIDVSLLNNGFGFMVFNTTFNNISVISFLNNEINIQLSYYGIE